MTSFAANPVRAIASLADKSAVTPAFSMSRPYQKKIVMPTGNGKFLVFLRSDPRSIRIVNTLDEAKAYVNKAARKFYQRHLFVDEIFRQEL